MQSFPVSPVELVLSLTRRKHLVFSLTKRELATRYKGSLLGALWSLIIPLMMLVIYTAVFAGVFKSRWEGSAQAGETPFALVLFAGLLVFNFFAECLNRAPSIILSQPNLVKKVVFPLEILVWVALGSALFNLAVSLAILLIAEAVLCHTIPWTAALFPVVLMPLALIGLGAMLFLSSLSVYIRDIAQVTGLITTALLFASAVFFPVSAIPEGYRWVVHVNPVAVAVEWSRGALVFGRLTDTGGTASSPGSGW